jgi:ABC-type Na+ efflux pump permease subunit
MGHAFGGKVKNLEVGVVDQDHGVPAVKLKEMLQAVAANARTFETVAYNDQAAALQDLRNGKISGVLNIPPNFSRKILAGANPRLALIEDNTDQFAWPLEVRPTASAALNDPAHGAFLGGGDALDR